MDCRALARFFVGVAQGLNVVHKAMADPAALQDMIHVAMQVWEPPPPPPNDLAKQQPKRRRHPQHESTRDHGL